MVVLEEVDVVLVLVVVERVRVERKVVVVRSTNKVDGPVLLVVVSTTE